MSPWTALFEALHSAMIDELVERHPEPKPELGLPVRMSRLANPSSAEPLEIVVCEISLGDTRGLAMIAASPQGLRSLDANPRELWDALLRRLGSQLMKHDIKPRFSSAERRDLASPPASWPAPGRVVWVPFKLKSGVVFLGMGV